jgi:hypothetical protein
MGTTGKNRLALSLAVLATGSAMAQGPIARGTAVSPPDCPSAADMVAEFRPAPTDRTYLRIQHIGEPGSAEVLGEVANPVTWDVGEMTGLVVPHQAQRGFRNDPPPVAASAFQLDCEGAGAYINTWEFSHRWPTTGGGPNASVARDFLEPFAVFRDGASMVIEGTVRVPVVKNQRRPIVDEGTAQVGFFYYAQDMRSGTVIAHLLGIFENRVRGVNGAGIEDWGWDGQVAFLMSPIAGETATGEPVRFLSWSPPNPAMQFEEPFAEPRLYRARITPQNFKAALGMLAAGPMHHISLDPADWRILSFGFLAEVFPGVGDEHNVALGTSVSGLALRSVPLAPAHHR